MLHLIWSVIVGAIVGGLAELIVPGAQNLGFFKCAVLGIVGSIVGGLIGRIFSRPAPGTSFHPAGFFMSLVCAVLLLILWLKFVAA